MEGGGGIESSLSIRPHLRRYIPIDHRIETIECVESCAPNRRHRVNREQILFHPSGSFRIKYWSFVVVSPLRIRYSYLRAESRLTLGHNIKKQYLPRRFFPLPSPPTPLSNLALVALRFDLGEGEGRGREGKITVQSVRTAKTRATSRQHFWKVGRVYNDRTKRNFLFASIGGMYARVCVYASMRA